MTAGGRERRDQVGSALQHEADRFLIQPNAVLDRVDAGRALHS